MKIIREYMIARQSKTRSAVVSVEVLFDRNDADTAEERKADEGSEINVAAAMRMRAEACLRLLSDENEILHSRVFPAAVCP